MTQTTYLATMVCPDGEKRYTNVRDASAKAARKHVLRMMADLQADGMLPAKAKLLPLVPADAPAPPVTQDQLEALATLLDDLICAADAAGQHTLSGLLNQACDAMEGAIDAIQS